MFPAAARKCTACPWRPFRASSVFAYLVLEDGGATLVDAGSGYGRSNDDLLAGIGRVRDDFGEAVSLPALRQVLITHGHIDHFGGLAFVRRHCRAPIAVHELDLRVLSNYEGRLVLVAQELRQFLGRAGVFAETQQAVMDMHVLHKALSRSVELALTYEAAGMARGPFQFHHLPGHCPGQVGVQIDDLLLSADRALSRISPHQAPEALAPYTGLGHYLESLHGVKDVPGIRLALGRHQEPIRDLPGRVDEKEPHASTLRRHHRLGEMRSAGHGDQRRPRAPPRHQR